MYFEALDAGGGVHGCTIRLIAEDHGYQMSKAVQAINELVSGDLSAADLSRIGTLMSLEAFELQGDKGVPNVSPMNAARQMIEANSVTDRSDERAFARDLRKRAVTRLRPNSRCP